MKSKTPPPVGFLFLYSRLVAFAALVAVSGPVSNAHAATFTYTPTSGAVSATNNWNDGVAAGWTSKPISASDTTLVFGTAAAVPPTFFTASAVVINSINNLPAPDLDVNGRFQLNNFTAGFKGLIFTTAPAIAPQVNISGAPLQFLADGPTNPVMALQANSDSSGTVGQKVVLVISNDIFVGAPVFTITSDTNFSGGSTAGNVQLTGGFNFSTTGAHALNFGGDGAPGGTNLLNGRSVFNAGIADSAAGPGNATTLTKSGTSMWELASANTYSGGTTITGGTLTFSNLGGLGSGSVSVSGGGAVMLNAAGTWAKDFSISGDGAGNFGAIRLSSAAVLSSSNTVTLTGDARIGGSLLRTQTATIDSRITGTGDLTFGTTSANGLTLVISNPNNDYVGNTIFQGEQSSLTSGSSSSAQDFILGASNVIAPGDVTLSMGTRSTLTLQMRGFSETINGLNFSGAGLLGRTITNNSTAANSASVLTLGANNASGTFRGSITGTNAKTVAVTKIGSGNQVLNGSTTYFGDTTVTDGKLTLDYNLYSSSQTNAPGNYFSQNSTLVLNGGSLAIGGRDAGSGGAVTGTLSGRVFTVSDTSGFVAGQSIQEVTSLAGAIFIAGIDRNANTLFLSEVPVFGTPNTINVDAMAVGTTSQTLKGFTLAGAVASTSTIDFGITGGVVLTINSGPIQINDGSLLSIANWSGNVSIGGGSDQLLFIGNPIDFTSVFNQSEVSFLGFGTGYSIIDNVGNYEVVAVPEPTTLGLLALGGMSLLALRRRRC